MHSTAWRSFTLEEGKRGIWRKETKAGFLVNLRLEGLEFLDFQKKTKNQALERQ